MSCSKCDQNWSQVSFESVPRIIFWISLSSYWINMHVISFLKLTDFFLVMYSILLVRETFSHSYAFVFKHNTHISKSSQQPLDRNKSLVHYFFFFSFSIIHYTQMYITLWNKRSADTSQLQFIADWLFVTTFATFLLVINSKMHQWWMGAPCHRILYKTVGGRNILQWKLFQLIHYKTPL